MLGLGFFKLPPSGILRGMASLFLDQKLQHLETRVIETFGELPPINPTPPEQYFDRLLESIVSQQLSVKVSDVIFARLRESVGVLSPATIEALSIESLRAIGLSQAKAQYCHNVAHAWNTSLSNYAHWESLSDQEIIEKLVTIKGVGNWTAEMFLIFTLGRPDVFSVGDYALRVAVRKLYDLPESSKPAEYLSITDKWQPHRSRAARILWKSLELPDTGIL